MTQLGMDYKNGQAEQPLCLTSNLQRPKPYLQWVLAGIIILLACAFAALGIWQVQRRSWKLNLIANVEARVHLPAAAPPAQSSWADLTAEKDEYRHVNLSGHFQKDADVLIYTPSDEGPAFWVLTPFIGDDGVTTIINRGRVPEEFTYLLKEVTGDHQTISGLLRMSEKKRWLFARHNDPTARKWYRRDVGSISRELGYNNPAPYFVDLDKPDQRSIDDAAADEWPKAGLTIIKFRNAHLVYALTWFGLSISCLLMLFIGRTVLSRTD